MKVVKGWGWRLSQVLALLAKAEASPNFCEAVRQTARTRLAEIDQTIRALTAQRAELEDFVNVCAAKPDHERCPVFKRLAGIPDESAAAR